MICLPSLSLSLTGAWNWVSTQVLPYIIDWMFILILGLLMALFSFAIDYLIEKVDEGKGQKKSPPPHQ